MDGYRCFFLGGMDIDAGYSMLRAYPSREILGLNWAKGHGVRQLGGLFLRFGLHTRARMTYLGSFG